MDLRFLQHILVEGELVICTTFAYTSNRFFGKMSLSDRPSSPLSLHRGSYMSAHVLLNLLNELGKRDKMRGLPSILSLFRNEFNKFNIT